MGRAGHAVASPVDVTIGAKAHTPTCVAAREPNRAYS